MKKLLDLASSLENKIDILLQRQMKMKEEIRRIRVENERLQGVLFQKEQDIVNAEDVMKKLKFANAMLGSDEYKRETKLKINSLIREIDKCVSHLNDQ